LPGEKRLDEADLLSAFRKEKNSLSGSTATAHKGLDKASLDQLFSEFGLDAGSTTPELARGEEVGGAVVQPSTVG
jgi:hypothetical protein